MVRVLDELAGRIYETGLRSRKPSFLAAAKLLERALDSHACSSSAKLNSKINYSLGLVYRNASERSQVAYHEGHLEKAIKHSQAAVAAADKNDRFAMACSKIALGNCLFDKARKTQDQTRRRLQLTFSKTCEKTSNAIVRFPSY